MVPFLIISEQAARQPPATCHLEEGRREEQRTYFTCCGSISALSSAALGSLRSYCLVGSGTSTKMGRDGVSSLRVTRDDLLTWSTSFFHAIYLGLPKNLTPVSPAHLRPTNKRHRRRRGKRRRSCSSGVAITGTSAHVSAQRRSRSRRSCANPRSRVHLGPSRSPRRPAMTTCLQTVSLCL